MRCAQGFRKGRGSLQAVGALKRITEQAGGGCGPRFAVEKMTTLVCTSIRCSLNDHTLFLACSCAKPPTLPGSPALIQRWLKLLYCLTTDGLIHVKHAGLLKNRPIDLQCDTDELTTLRNHRLFSRLRQSKHFTVDGVLAQRHKNKTLYTTPTATTLKKG